MTHVRAWFMSIPPHCLLAVRGEADDDDDAYEVDFLAKGGWLVGNRQAQLELGGTSGGRAAGYLDDEPPAAGHAAGAAGIRHEESSGVDREGSQDPEERRRQEERERQQILEEEQEDVKRRQRTEVCADTCYTGVKMRQVLVIMYAAAYAVVRCMQVVLELARETRESRQRASQSKRVRDEQSRSKLDKLKEAFLKRAAEAARQTAKTGKGGKVAQA